MAAPSSGPFGAPSHCTPLLHSREPLVRCKASLLLLPPPCLSVTSRQPTDLFPSDSDMPRAPSHLRSSALAPPILFPHNLAPSPPSPPWELEDYHKSSAVGASPWLLRVLPFTPPHWSFSSVLTQPGHYSLYLSAPFHVVCPPKCDSKLLECREFPANPTAPQIGKGCLWILAERLTSKHLWMPLSNFKEWILN